MKASKYQRRHQGPLPDAILKTLMEYHGCVHHAGANSGACLADFIRTDLIMDTLDHQITDTLRRMDAEAAARSESGREDGPEGGSERAESAETPSTSVGTGYDLGTAVAPAGPRDGESLGDSDEPRPDH